MKDALSLTTVRYVAKILAAAYKLDIHLRSRPILIGDYRAPAASEIVRFLNLAQSEFISVRKEQEFRAIGLQALYLLALHPLNDGNGRMARIVTLGSLLSLGWTLGQALLHVDLVFNKNARNFVLAGSRAFMGDPEPFLLHWADPKISLGQAQSKE